MSAEQAIAAVRSGETSAEALLDAHLARAEDDRWGSFLALDADRARARARDIDALAEKPPLAGIPFAVKDALSTRDLDDDRRLPHPRGLPPRLHGDLRRAPRGRRRGDHRQDQHGRVRHGLVHRELGLPADPQPLGPRPGARADRAAARPPRWRRARLRGRSARTPAARSASRRRCAGSSG